MSCLTGTADVVMPDHFSIRARPGTALPAELAHLEEATQSQLATLVAALSEALGPGLGRVILHGSAATSGFEPERSDLDVLVVSNGSLTAAQRHALARGLLEISGTPHPIELSVVTRQSLAAWSHPCPYEFHFGEDCRSALSDGTCPRRGTDPDLAAHVTVARARGLELLRGAVGAPLPDVPQRDFLAALLGDFEWAARREAGMEGYVHANACRTWAFLKTGQVLSKVEGVEWCRAQGVRSGDVVADVVRRLRAELPG